LWFPKPECIEFKLGIQLLPLIPITKLLFSYLEYVMELVDLARKNGDVDIEDGWKGFIFVFKGVYDTIVFLQKA